jgi:hypothetical protein
MSATATIARLLKTDPEWRAFFRSCCEAGAPRLRSQARRFRDELRDREPGEAFALADVEDALLMAARKALPGTPAAEWDPQWAEELCRDALARLQEVYAGLTFEERDALDLSAKDEHEDLMLRAGLDNDPPAFRAALTGWERTATAALGTARAATRSESA